MFKFKNKTKEKKQINIISIAILIVFVLILSLTIGFSSFQSSFDIGTLGAHVMINKNIRVTNITLNNTSGNAISNWEEYNVKNISSNIDLPNASSTVTYVVEITNIGNIEMGIFDITGLSNNLNYSISNYTLKDELCDTLDPTECKLGSKTLLNITISYKDNSYNSSNTNFNIDLEFDFRRFYSITYVNLNSTNLPTKVIEGDIKEFYLNTPYPERIHFSGTTTSTYNPLNGKVTLNNINDNVIISYISMTYFVAYNGNNNQLFNIFNDTNITSFERNTTLTLSEVQAKVNNNTAYKISTEHNDANYPSDHEVYGWVDNNKFYWWSEASTVYYHPNTRGAFRLMTNLLTVDLTGTNTSYVKNFSHWFDKDAKLRTITGKINTSGLVLEYNPNFNYGTDNDENASGETGLGFMFNDCKALTSVDLSEFNTTNAGDMKRTFGGCNVITSLDVSNFDTSNAKSMYWMFRKNERLTEIDLRSFDTSKVENMTGMFVNDNNLKKVYLGTNFNTSKVKKFNYMFSSAGNLTTIYAYNDFQTNSLVESTNMFSNSTKLVGSANTIDETTFDSSHTNISYAKLAKNGISGYLTPYSTSNYYTITYDVDGAINNNPIIYYEDTMTFTLQAPQKSGHTFIGWTGSNGNTPELTVTIPQGSTGNRTYVAHFQENVVDVFPKVFYIAGSCNFNGSLNNITGSTCVSSLSDATDYTNGTYIDTGIQLYNSENLEKDYEIYFELSNYNPSEQETMPDGNKQNTIMNTKAEQSGYPGVVFRKNNDSLDIKSFDKSHGTWYRNVSTVKIARINKKIYYSINGANFTLLNDNTSFNSPFNLSVWFGASKNSSGQPFRHSKCTLSNIYIKLGTYD